MLLFNALLTCLCLWAILNVNYRYLQPTLRNKRRFRLYRLRDELSLCAMRGELDERSPEYRTLLVVLNGAIRALGTFQVVDFLKFLVRVQKDTELRSLIDKIQSNLSSTKHAEYCRVASQTFSIMHEMLVVDTRTLRYLIPYVILPLFSLLSLLRLPEPKQVVERRQRLIREVDQDIEHKQTVFAAACVIH